MLHAKIFANVQVPQQETFLSRYFANLSVVVDTDLPSQINRDMNLAEANFYPFLARMYLWFRIGMEARKQCCQPSVRIFSQVNKKKYLKTDFHKVSSCYKQQ
jgi:hypothetical protein